MTSRRSRPPHIEHATLLLPWLCAATLSGVAAPASAHHSSALYDLSREITIGGVVTRYEWANPHVYIFVASTLSDDPVTWAIEASPPALMARRGWSPTSMAPGDHVVIVASPARNPMRHVALGTTIRSNDGAVLAMRGSNALVAAPSVDERASTLSGTWLGSVEPATTGRFVQPHGAEAEAAKTWPLTAKGLDAVVAYAPVTNPSAECTAYTAPFTMVFPDLKIIAIGDEVTTIRTELDDVERVVHMNAPSHDGAPYSNQGHSIGRWEGETLVVDTTRFEVRQSGNSFQLPSSRDKHLVERFELSDEGSALTYRFTVEDPEFFTGTVSGAINWAYAPQREFAAHGCDLENASRYLN